MKRTINLLGIATLLLALTSCGGSQRGYFGDVPKTLNNKIEKFMEFQAKAENVESAEEFGRLVDESDKLETQLDADIEKAVAQTEGVQIECEVSEGLPFQITAAPLLSNGYKYSVKGSLTTTADIALDSENPYPNYVCYVKYVDAEGRVIKLDECPLFVGKPGEVVASGTDREFSFAYWFDDRAKPEQIEKNNKLASLSKIVFISEADYKLGQEQQ